MNLRQAAEMALEALEIWEKMQPNTSASAVRVPAIQALRQALTPEVPCKTDPRAPHGFDRNASHSADRYVCECEGWEPVDNAYTKLDTTAGVLHKEWVGLTEEEIFQAYKPEMEGMPFNKPTLAVVAGYIEAKLKEKNT